MSDTNRATLGYIKESTFGVFPSGPPKLKLLRFTRESLGTDTDVKVSEEIRQDAQDADVVRTGLRGAGEMAFELSQDSFDDWMQSGIRSGAWSTEVAVVTAGTNVQAIAVSNRFQIATAWTNTPAVGTWVKVTGFATGGNLGYFKVAASTSTQIDVAQLGVLVDEAAGPAITIKGGSQILNGTVFETYSIERGYTDLASEFVQLLGFGIDGFSINVPVDGFVNGAFTFVGKKELSMAATGGDGAPTAQTGTDVFNAIDDIMRIEEANAAQKATAFGFAIRNNLRGRPEIGTLGATDLGTGSIGATGTLQQYFKTKTLFDKYVGFVTTSLALLVQRGGEGYVFEFPKVKLGGGRRVAGGKNADIIADLSWIATRHPTENVTVRIARWT